MKKLTFLSTLILLYLMPLVSCGDDDGGGAGENQKSLGGGSDNAYYLSPSSPDFQKVLGSWQFTNFQAFDFKGNRLKTEDPLPRVMTFTTEKDSNCDSHEYVAECYLIDYQYLSKTHYWSLKSNGHIKFSYADGRIISINSQQMVIREEYSDHYRLLTWTKTAGHTSTVGNNPSGGQSGGAPEFTNFIFTATQTSVTVKFYTDSRVSSATVYYGTSTPSKIATSSISNTLVSATINGLTKGTKYYVKCKATNSYGSSTSDTYSVITNY